MLEPTVIFFGLTDLPTMFQLMMNKILQDLVNTREVVSFIDDVIVEAEEEKRYDKVVEKVVMRLAENNLYVKPEK